MSDNSKSTRKPTKKQSLLTAKNVASVLFPDEQMLVDDVRSAPGDVSAQDALDLLDLVDRLAAEVARLRAGGAR